MTTRVCLLTIGLIVTIAGAAEGQTPLGSSFTYQGLLKNANVPVSPSANFVFSLWNDPTSVLPANQIGSAITQNGVPVTDGLFTVVLNQPPGVEFGTNAFNGDARWLEITVNGTTLSPRQQLSPTPHALALPGLYTQQNATSPNIIGGHNGNLTETSTSAAVVGATIAGGGSVGIGVNKVTDNYGTVGGGANNRAGGNNSSATNELYGTVAGGRSNVAQGDYSAVGGGQNQSATGDYSTIAGGEGNVASGARSTVPGGQLNTASGSFSLAAGRRAKANHDGAVVIADSTDADFASTAANQFLVRATGGVKLNVDASGGGMRIESTTIEPTYLTQGNNILAGHAVNQVSAGVVGGTIAGGGLVDDPNGTLGSPVPHPNIVTDRACTISGGFGNRAGDNAGTPSDTVGAVIGGGAENVASASFSTIAGGRLNETSNYAATVGGGYDNTASGGAATVGGGGSNTASGDYSTVPGGGFNNAAGPLSFAAGWRANAIHTGAFVLADSIDADFTSTGPNQFLIRAEGGVGIGTNSPTATRLHVLQSTSGRNAIKAEHTGFSDDAAIYGIHSDPVNVLGIGVKGVGGRMGVEGITSRTGPFAAYGVRGEVTTGPTGATSFGVYGNANASGSNYGVYGFASGGTVNYAGFFAGDVVVSGTLFKSGGSFKIDHPLDPENKYLYHSFVESPDMMNIYNGAVVLGAAGRAEVTMPEWFESLNRDFRYQLTPIGGSGPNLYIAEEIVGNKFAIAGGKPGLKVSWQVTGIRHDKWAEANRIPVEQVKQAEEKGLYLHPEAFGLEEAKGIDYQVRAKDEQHSKQEKADEIGSSSSQSDSQSNDQPVAEQVPQSNGGGR